MSPNYYTSLFIIPTFCVRIQPATLCVVYLGNIKVKAAFSENSGIAAQLPKTGKARVIVLADDSEKDAFTNHFIIKVAGVIIDLAAF